MALCNRFCFCLNLGKSLGYVWLLDFIGLIIAWIYVEVELCPMSLFFIAAMAISTFIGGTSTIVISCNGGVRQFRPMFFFAFVLKFLANLAGVAGFIKIWEKEASYTIPPQAFFIIFCFLFICNFYFAILALNYACISRKKELELNI